MIDPALEGQYNNRARVADFADHLASWAAKTAAWRAAAACIDDLACGPGPSEKLDLYPARGAAGMKAPLHVFIHGGYWQALTKRECCFVARPLVAAGLHVAMIDYALCPSVTIDEIGRQVRASLAWLWRNADRHGIDRNRITVSGHSCGGHLVGMAMATDWRDFGADLPADLVKGGVSVSGLFDLEPLRHTSVNDKVGMDAATARRNSPVFMTPAASTAPLALFFGGDEGEEFHRQSRDMAAAWSALGVPVTCAAIPGANHFSILTGMDDPAHPAVAAILDLAF